MERYGWGSVAPEVMVQSDPPTEWSGTGVETGLEEPMWQLGLGEGDGGSGGGGVGDGGAYPERPDEADCIYYLRTGFCGYGPRCRFNHPRDRSMVVGAIRHGRGDYPERVDQPLCQYVLSYRDTYCPQCKHLNVSIRKHIYGQYYMRTGMCKFGSSCKYNHPRQGSGSSHVSVNYLGYPLRPGEKECAYYMKTGRCKFDATCKFHHPELESMQAPAPSPAPVPAHAYYSAMPSPSNTPSQQYGVMAGNWQVTRPPPLLPGSYIQGYGPMILSPGMVPIAGWSPYPAPVNQAPSPSTQPTVGTGPFYGITQLSPSAPAYTGGYPLIPSSVGPSSIYPKENIYPERPGQPECQFYMKTGECKYGSSCRYHHPQELLPPRTSVVLSPMNLPMRPGAPSCTYYAQHGVCKFGPTCKFDHPMGGTLSYSSSASSFADLPVAPYPIGSTVVTSAPSSSSTELPPNVTFGSNDSTRITSSITTSSSIGSILSKDPQISST